MLKENYLPGISGTWRPKASTKGLLWDTARGIATFHGAETPPAPGPARAANAVGTNGVAGAVGASEDEADGDGDCSDNPEVRSGAADEAARSLPQTRSRSLTRNRLLLPADPPRHVFGAIEGGDRLTLRLRPSKASLA